MLDLGKTNDFFLWWSFRRVEWFQRMITRRVTFLGWVVIIGSFASLLFGTDVVSNALGYLSILGSLLVVVEWLSLLGRRSRLGVSYIGRSGSELFAGTQVTLPFQVTSEQAIRRVHLRLYPWEGEPSFSQFYEGREPFEKQRNFVDRFLKYYRWKWLKSRNEPFEAVRGESLEMAPGEAQRVELVVNLSQRGSWSLINMRAQRAGVFELLERSQKTKGARGKIHVAPKTYAVRRTLNYGPGQADESSLESHPEVGESQEFLSIREYRPGDSWRKVNWKAMARTNKAMIQEMEELAVPRYAVVWETQGMTEEEFEVAASVVASVMMYFVQSGEKGEVIIHHGGSKRYDWNTERAALLHALAMIQQGEVWPENLEVSPLRHEAFPYHVSTSQRQREEGKALVITGKCVNGVEIEKGVSL